MKVPLNVSQTQTQLMEIMCQVVYADGRKAAAAKPDDGAAVRGPAAAADDESEDEDVDIDAI